MPDECGALRSARTRGGKDARCARVSKPGAVQRHCGCSPGCLCLSSLPTPQVQRAPSSGVSATLVSVLFSLCI